MVKRFFASRRTGFYLAVTKEGEVGAGDEMKLVHSDANRVPVSEIMRLYAEKQYSGANAEAAQRAMLVEALPESWKEYFRERLEPHPDQG